MGFGKENYDKNKDPMLSVRHEPKKNQITNQALIEVHSLIDKVNMYYKDVKPDEQIKEVQQRKLLNVLNILSSHIITLDVKRAQLESECLEVGKLLEELRQARKPFEAQFIELEFKNADV